MCDITVTMSSDSPLDSIARRLGVSKNTVSAILRERPGYAQATRERVKAVAAEMGYQTNPMVSALMRGIRRSRPGQSQGNLAFLHPSSPEYLKKKLFARSLYEHAAARAVELGFALVPLAIPSPDPRGLQLKRLLRARGIEGVVVAPLEKNSGRLRLDMSNLAGIALGFSLMHPDLHRVATNQYHVMWRVLHELRHLGYHRIGVCLNPELDARFDFAWQAGLAVQRHTRPASELPHPLNQTKLEKERFCAWFTRYKPQVLVDGGHQLLRFLDAMKVRVPKDVGYVELTAPGLPDGPATVARDWKALGATAVDQIAAMLVRNERGVPAKAQITLINGTWSPGNTLRTQT